MHQLKKFYIQTYGCQMNYSDSERFASLLIQHGLKRANSRRDADIIIFNTCSVRQKAEDRIFGMGKEIEKLKTKRKENGFAMNRSRKRSGSWPITILTGCIARRKWSDKDHEQKKQEKNLKKLRRQLPFFDIIIETKDFPKVLDILKLGKKKTKISKSTDYLKITPEYQNKHQAYVPISTGCNHFCTYCIVPYARGKEANRNPEEILCEIEGLIKNGYKDITLVGQSVNRWHNPNVKSFDLRKINTKNLKNNQILINKQSPNTSCQIPVLPRDFLQLLQLIDSIPGDYWLSFISSYPNYFTDELIDFVSESIKLEKGHIRPYIHLALQSGSDKILKKMNRKYSIEQFIKICEKFRDKIPNLTLSTDLIVGFPGETERDFQDTVEVLKKLRFNMIYLNEYSTRSGTAAALMKDNVSREIKRKRKKYLNDEVLGPIALEDNKEMISRVEKCLIEKVDRNNNGYGRTYNFRNIKIKSKKKLKAGEFINVKIVGASSWGLEGKELK